MEEASGGRMHYMFNRVGGLKEDLPAGWLGPGRACRRRQCGAGSPTSSRSSSATRSSRRAPAASACSTPATMRGLRRLGSDRARQRASTSTCGATSPTSRTPSCSPRAARAGSSPAPRATAWPGSRCCSSRCTSASTSPRPASTGSRSLPAGPGQRQRLPKVLKVPEGDLYTATENPLGFNGYYLVSRGEKTPWRLKLRSASFNNVAGARRGAARQPHRRHGGDPRLDVLRRRRRRQVALSAGRRPRGRCPRRGPGPGPRSGPRPRCRSGTSAGSPARRAARSAAPRHSASSCQNRVR